MPSPIANVQVPLLLLTVQADAKTAFFGLCLTAGQQVFQTLMEPDREQLCGPKHVPNPDRTRIGAAVCRVRSCSAGGTSSCPACAPGA